MTKADFLASLRNELRDVSTEEREEAIKFYTEYFEEAGEENEQNVLNELDSPLEVANKIRTTCTGVPATRDQRNGYRSAPRQSSTSRTVLIIILAIITSPVWIGIAAGAVGMLVGLAGAAVAFIASGFGLVFGGTVGFFASLPIVAANTPSGLIAAGVSLVLVAVGLLISGGLIYAISKGVPALGKAIGRLFKRRHT